MKEFRESFSAVVANGQGEMKGKLFRIAHIGYYDYLDTIGILAALEHVLASVTGKPVEYGAAVRAAQEVYAQSEKSGSSCCTLIIPKLPRISPISTDQDLFLIRENPWPI